MHNFKNFAPAHINQIQVLTSSLISELTCIEEVTILLTKFTSVNLEDHNPQKAAKGVMPTFVPFGKSQKRLEKQCHFFHTKLISHTARDCMVTQ